MNEQFKFSKKIPKEQIALPFEKDKIASENKISHWEYYAGDGKRDLTGEEGYDIFEWKKGKWEKNGEPSSFKEFKWAVGPKIRFIEENDETFKKIMEIEKNNL